MIWELVFMLVILKIPVVYLCWVVWWAVRATPDPLAGAGRLAPVTPSGPECDWRRRLLDPRRLGPRLHGPRRPRGGRPGRVLHARGRVTR